MVLGECCLDSKDSDKLSESDSHVFGTPVRLGGGGVIHEVPLDPEGKGSPIRFPLRVEDAGQSCCDACDVMLGSPDIQ